MRGLEALTPAQPGWRVVTTPSESSEEVVTISDWTGVLPEIAGGGALASAGWFARAALDRWRERQPLRLHLDEDPRVIYRNTPPWVSFPCFFPRPASAVPPPPSGGPLAWWAWARQNGGIPAVYSESQVTIQCKTKTSVLVDGIEISTHEEWESPSGTIVFHPTGGADITHRQFAVNLSTFVSTAIPVEAGGERVKSFSFTVSESDIERVSLRASSSEERRIFKWSATLHLIAGGSRRTHEINSEAKPFELHTGGLPFHYWSGDSWQLNHT